MSSLRVAVIGAKGRMGRYATELLESTDGFEVVACVEKDDDPVSALRAARPVVGLDLTVAGLGAAHGRVMLENDVRCVIGTSGVRPEEVHELDELARARRLGGLVVPNFSLGIWPAATLRGRRRALPAQRRDRRRAPRAEKGLALGNGRAHRAAPGRGDEPPHRGRPDPLDPPEGLVREPDRHLRRSRGDAGARAPHLRPRGVRRRDPREPAVRSDPRPASRSASGARSSARADGVPPRHRASRVERPRDRACGAVDGRDRRWCNPRESAGMAKSVDAMDSKSISRKGVGVRVPFPVPAR